MRFFRKPRPTDTEEDESIDLEDMELPVSIQPNSDLKPTRKKRQMLTISNIDESLLATIISRAKAKGIPLYEYCSILLKSGLVVEDVFNKPKRKHR